VAIELSIVLPIYNEAAGIRGALDRLDATLAGLGRPYEIVCVDDGSTDQTPILLDALAEAMPHLRVVRFTRNFGKEAALHAGLRSARGEAAIFMDADLQHPPELIPQMVELWAEEGFDVVDARKRERGQEGRLYRLLAGVFYRLLAGATDADMFGASDYKLLSRSAMDALAALPERNRFFRGLVEWIGFRTARVAFDVEPRRRGQSRWGRLALLRYAIDSILSFTTFPLVLIAVAGVVTTGIGSVLGGIALYQWATGAAVSGFTTVILMLLIFSGLILVSLGTMSLYLGRLFEEVKRRPLYVVNRPTKSADAGGDGR
jgi:polyisoprenyl-phosphate glycosyltransferase